MKYHDLRDFITQLEKIDDLKRVSTTVSPQNNMTEICDRVLKAQGAAMLFERPAGHNMPVLCNLFGTPRRVALGMREESIEALQARAKAMGALGFSDHIATRLAKNQHGDSSGVRGVAWLGE